MKGIVKEVYKVYNSGEMQLVVPVYQRNYDWQLKHCEQLVTDLVETIKGKRPKHFFGAVVGKNDTAWKWIVIDGQQRLTTVSLLMLAICTLIDSGELAAEDTELAGQIRRSYLVSNSAGKETAKFRLKPVKNDANAYERLFGPESEWLETSNVTANYKYFLKVLPKSGLSADDLWEAVQRLEVMHLDLEGHDDPQRIFESLNSTGLALSEADKIRNLVLMDLSNDEQERVYEDYWNRIEINVSYETDTFLRWYLVTKTTTTPRYDQVYDAFKEFAHTSGLKGSSLLDEIRTYSTYYSRLKSADTGSKSADRVLRRLNILAQEVTLPLLMPLLGEFLDNRIEEDDFVRSLKIVDAYLARRFVCGYEANALNKIFATLFREIRKMRTENTPFSHVLAYSLLKRSGTGAFPLDAEFAEEFQTRNFYKISAERRRYLFESLENLDSNDTRDIERGIQDGSLTIEHVMPQTLTPAWREELGPNADEIHATWLHRIGNLTVTGYNSRYSNASFTDKKTMENGFDDSPFRLNKILRNSETWGLEQLEDRTQELLRSAQACWPLPETDFVPPRAVLPMEELGDDADFTHRVIVAFSYQDQQVTVDSWRTMLDEVIRLIGTESREALFEYARTNESFKVLDRRGDLGYTWIEPLPGLFASAQTSTQTKLILLRNLFHHLGISTSELVFTLRPTSVENTADDVQEEAEEQASAYGPITKFVDEFDEYTGSTAPVEDTFDLRTEFAKNFDPFSVANPVAALGMAAGAFASNEDFMRDASEEQLLSLISAKLIEDLQFNPGALHQAIVDGSLTTWLRALDPKKSTAPSGWTSSEPDLKLLAELWEACPERAQLIFTRLSEHPGRYFSGAELARELGSKKDGSPLTSRNVAGALSLPGSKLQQFGKPSFWNYHEGYYSMTKAQAELMRRMRSTLDQSSTAQR